MIALVGAVLAVSVIAACVGQIYYCGKPTENYGEFKLTILSINSTINTSKMTEVSNDNIIMSVVIKSFILPYAEENV